MLCIGRDNFVSRINNADARAMFHTAANAKAIYYDKRLKKITEMFKKRSTSSDFAADLPLMPQPEQTHIRSKSEFSDLKGLNIPWSNSVKKANRRTRRRETLSMTTNTRLLESIRMQCSIDMGSTTDLAATNLSRSGNNSRLRN